MAVCTLGGITFPFDPDSVTWTYHTKTSTVNTVGGKVVQVYGTSIDNIVITGSFGQGGRSAQEAFSNQVEAWIDAQVGDLTAPSNSGQGVFNGSPLRFTFPPRGWDMQVYIYQYFQPGDNFSIALDLETINYKWGLSLWIVNDNGSLANETDASMIQYVNRLGENFGWFPTAPYNGPVAQGQYPSLVPVQGQGT